MTDEIVLFPDLMMMDAPERAEAEKRNAEIQATRIAQAGAEPAEARPQEGKLVRGVFYRGPKHDWSTEPRYDKMPAAVNRAFKKEGSTLSPSDGMFATAIYRHLQHARSDKAARLTNAKLGASLHRSADTAARSIARLLAEDVITVKSSGRGRVEGTLFAFAAR